jgi:hypothetical protein
LRACGAREGLCPSCAHRSMASKRATQAQTTGDARLERGCSLLNRVPSEVRVMCAGWCHHGWCCRVPCLELDTLRGSHTTGKGDRYVVIGRLWTDLGFVTCCVCIFYGRMCRLNSEGQGQGISTIEYRCGARPYGIYLFTLQVTLDYVTHYIAARPEMCLVCLPGSSDHHTSNLVYLLM